MNVVVHEVDLNAFRETSPLTVKPNVGRAVDHDGTVVGSVAIPRKARIVVAARLGTTAILDLDLHIHPRVQGNLQDPVREAASRSRSLDDLSDVPQQVRINNSEGSSTTVHADSPSARGSETVSTVTMLAEALRSLQPTRSHNYYVSNFDPNIHDIDAWCEEVDRAAVANGWRDHECLSRVASCLKGDAKVWLNEWVTNDRTWSNFKLEFKPLCPRKLDYANILFEAMNTTSDKYTTYAEYARRTLLRLRIVKGLSDELRTLIVIRGIDNPQIRAAAANANLATEDIVSFLSIYVKPNRAKPDSCGTATNKHSSSNSSSDRGPKCYICNQRGHVGRNCIKKTRKESSDRSTVKSGTQGSVNDTTAASKSELLCSFCKKRGHTEEKCFAKNRSEQRNQRNVNLCASHANNKTDIVTAVVQGIPMDALIDSGAQNVSLISSDVLKHLSCQVKPTHCVLKGISEREIVASSFITATIELSDISIETDLVVVPKSCMNTSLIIGTDVLNRDGVTYVRTKDRQYITRASDTPACVNEVLRLDQTLVNTPLQGALRDSLMSVINKFSNFLITGTATSTVTTGYMEIKLTNTTPIVYRPYKLSYNEKLVVREIIRDLLDKGIIRESRSEYASPIILVKKKDGSDRMCVDYRALNRITEKERYPLPLIDDHIDRLGRYTFFSSLDMATGFHQIRIKESSVHVTGFVTPEGHYEFLKMPYGLTNSPISVKKHAFFVLYPRAIDSVFYEFSTMSMSTWVLIKLYISS
ncbi:uncharacterized protein LOC126912845 [Spodoptera frugiperda]|uniref:Uncharacterized protein LOC126912845 n=1 Tax=Spodoptera frugiperda TaxID=7108 RepID=A0A9R0ED68_SPOFR|nr:uncharacterized protein LOC126912845 [Spodoptera frugiperda]